MPTSKLLGPVGVDQKLTAAERKHGGVHFTPVDLADLVADRLIDVLPEGSPLCVMDPACGDGALLAAYARRAPTGVRARSTLVGIDSDPASLGHAETRLRNTPIPATFIRSDFLAACGESGLFSSGPTLPNANVIIANPPYVRTQILGADRSKRLGDQFELTGRVDLYHAFLIAIARHLSAGGVMGIITSNRFLTTEGGESVRRFLADAFDIVELIDLGDTKLFEAAVLPAVIIARRRPQSASATTAASPPRFTRIYERRGPPDDGVASTEATSICEAIGEPACGAWRVAGRAFDVTTGTLVLPADHAEPWRLVTARQQRWLDAVDARRAQTFGDVAAIRVGVKSTADAVFIRHDWQGLPPDVRPEASHLRPILSQRNASKWTATIGDHEDEILYTHEVRDGARRPIDFQPTSATWRYLLSHRTRLASRAYVTQAGRRWYELWVPQDPDAWKRPKLVFPDISAGPKFFLDRGGAIVDGNCYWIAPAAGDESLLLLMLGVANSRLIERYHDLRFQNKLYAGRRRYLTQYVRHYPLPARDHVACPQIVTLVRRLIAEPTSSLHASLESEVDRLVAEAFGFTGGSDATD